MAFELTDSADAASKQIDVKPNIVLKIDGVDELYGAVEILHFIRYGEDDISYGDLGLVYGGSVALEGQSSYISFGSGTSTEIRQTLQVDKGKAESISNLTIGLIDKNQEITNLITPGQVIPDINGRRVKVYFGFGKTSFPDDYIIIFRGVVQSTESLPGVIKLNLSHPDQKKRSTIFNPGTTELTGSLSSGATVTDVTSTSDFLAKIAGPDGATIDADFRTYVRINDEIMQFETKSGTQFQSLTRGELGTTAAAHAIGDDVQSFYRIGGVNSNGIDLALKLMLSGENTYQFTAISPTNFVRTSLSETVANTIFFKSVNVESEYNIAVGDFIETTGASNGANNISPSATIKITGVTTTGDGSYITLGGVSFVEEVDTTALLKIRSQFDVFPEGLLMKADEVDIQEHLDIKNSFLPDFELDFYLTKEITGKDFLSDQIYNPMSCMSLPRKSQASMGIHQPPLPTEELVILDLNNVISPKAVKLQRSTTKNITNTVLYKHDELALFPEEFSKNTLSLDATAIDQLGVGRKSLVLEAKGMRASLGATTQATAAASRRLRKYSKGAEFLSGIQLHFRDGFKLEVGDKVLLDFSALQLSDIQTGARGGESRVMQIDNKRLNLKNGKVVLDLVDTNFDKSNRFGVVSPSSKIKSASSTTTWVIEESYYSRYGVNEFKKWDKYIGAQIRVTSSDFTTRDDNATILSISGNEIVTTGLSFTPQVGDIMNYSKYSNQVLDNVRTVFVHLSDASNDFADGGKFYGLF